MQSQPGRDEVDAKLSSNLFGFGALVQSVEVAARLLEADAAAGRLYEVPAPLPTCYGSCPGLAPSPRDVAALEAWPERPDSPFERLRSGRIGEVFGLGDIVPPKAQAARRIKCPVEPLAPVLDGLGAWVSVSGQVWAAMLFLRCEGNRPFDEASRQALARYQRPMRERFRLGYRVDLGLGEVGGSGQDGETTAAAVYQHLSDTERQVLHYLEEGWTEPQIAEALGRSRHTVHVHVKSIYRKLNVRSKRQLREWLGEST
jgi:DNA-binding CsgD family transcriptional regulator